MERSKAENLLRVEQERGSVVVEVKGTTEEVLVNWAVATHAVCEQLNMSPFALAGMLPGMVLGVQRGLAGHMSVGMDAVQRAEEGRHGAGK